MIAGSLSFFTFHIREGKIDMNTKTTRFIFALILVLISLGNSASAALADQPTKYGTGVLTITDTINEDTGNIIYLPLVFNGTPPPTDIYNWTGTTSNGNPMSFDVSSDGGSWSNFKLEEDFEIDGCYGTITITLLGPGAITNKRFSSNGSFSFSGQFNSLTTASGTYSFVNFYILNCGYFTKSGVWTASKP